MRNVCIIAGGMSQWGIREASLRDMFQEAGKACFEDNKAVTNKDIDGLIVASAYTERCSFQTHLAPLVAEYLGIKPRSICARVELLCASGSSGIILAYGLIRSGIADVVMVAGGEKLYRSGKMGDLLQRNGLCGSRLGWSSGLGPSPTCLCDGGQATYETIRNDERTIGFGLCQESKKRPQQSKSPVQGTHYP